MKRKAMGLIASFVLALTGALALVGCDDVHSEDVLNGEWEVASYESGYAAVKDVKFELENGKGTISYVMASEPVSFAVTCSASFQSGSKSGDKHRTVDKFISVRDEGKIYPSMQFVPVSDNVVVGELLNRDSGKNQRGVVMVKKTEGSLVDAAKITGTYSVAVKQWGSASLDLSFGKMTMEGNKVKLLADNGSAFTDANNKPAECDAQDGKFSYRYTRGTDYTDYMFIPVETNDEYIVYNVMRLSSDAKILASAAVRLDK